MKRKDGLKHQPRQSQNGERVLIKLRLDQLQFQDNKNQRRVQKYCQPVKVIQKARKASYRTQLLPWMQTILVLHVSNLKRYYLDQKDTRHKEVVQSHATKKSFTTKKVGEILTEKTQRAYEPRTIFHQFLEYGRDSSRQGSAGSASKT